MAGEFKLRRGLKNVFVAEVLTDDATSFTTGTPYHLMPAGEMTRSPSTDTANTWFDDVVFAAVGSEGATEISISGASLRADAIARLLGKDIDDTTGAVVDAGEYVEKYYALGGEAEGLDGSSEFFWFMKGTFSAPEEDDKTKDDSTDANGMTLTYNAIQTTHVFTLKNKVAKRVVIDTTKSKVKTSKSWTAQVVTPDNLSTIVEKVIPVTGLTVSPATATIDVDATTNLTATLAPSGASGTVNWITSDASVATVSDAGVVTGVAEGTATIVAICGDYTAAATITVSDT